MSSNHWNRSEQTTSAIPSIVSIPPVPPLPVEENKRNVWTNRTECLENERKGEENSYQISANTCGQYWNFLTKDLGEDFVMLSLYNDVESVIQNGPKCGLVSLMMCQSLVSTEGPELTQNELFETAKELGFTKTGEMFSVENMSKLANRVLSVRTEIKLNLKEQMSELVVHLASGLPALIPYDSDANHEPTLLAGQRAHWAIVLGFCIAINKDDLKESDLSVIRDERNRQLIHLRPKHSLPDFVFDIINRKSFKRFMVYAKQGKSKHLHIWDFNKLCESNSNLVKTSRKLNESQIVLPLNGGIVKGLNNQSLFIYNKCIDNCCNNCDYV